MKAPRRFPWGGFEPLLSTGQRVWPPLPALPPRSLRSVYAAVDSVKAPTGLYRSQSGRGLAQRTERLLLRPVYDLTALVFAPAPDAPAVRWLWALLAGGLPAVGLFLWRRVIRPSVPSRSS